MRNGARWAVGFGVVLAAAGVCAPLQAAPLGDDDARAVAETLVEGQLKGRAGFSVQHAPIEPSVALGEARRVTVQNLSYLYKDIKVNVGRLVLLVEPAEAASTGGDAVSDAVGPLYPVSFHFPESMAVLNKGKPAGTVQIGYSNVRTHWAPKIKAFLTSTTDVEALAFSGPQGMKASLASAAAEQSFKKAADTWSSNASVNLRGLAVEAQGTTVKLDGIQETMAVDGFPLEAWMTLMKPLADMLAKAPDLATAEGDAAMTAVLGQIVKAPPFADHLALDMKMSGFSVANNDGKVGLGQFGVTMGYEGLSPAPAAAEGEAPVGLGRYRFGFTLNGLSVPQDPIRDVFGPDQTPFILHSIPTDVGFRVDVSNVPTRALLELAQRAGAAQLARDRKDPIADTADDTAEKLAGDAWQLLKRVKTGLETGFDIASDMVKINSLSRYVADASLPTGQTNTTRITVAGLDDLLASYKAPDHTAPPKRAPDKPVAGKPAPAKPSAKAADDDGSILNYALLGVRFIKGIGTPKVSDGKIVYDYLIETDQNGTTRVNGQDFSAMIDSFGKNQPSKM